MATTNIFWGFSVDGTELVIRSNSNSPAVNKWVQDSTYVGDAALMTPPWQDGTYDKTAVTKLTFNNSYKVVPYYTYRWFDGFTGLVNPTAGSTYNMNIDMSACLDASCMFRGCTNLETLTLNTTNFCLKKIVKADSMFENCCKLSSLTTANACWTTTNATLESAVAMFEQCYMLSDFSFLTRIKTANLKEASWMLAAVGVASGVENIPINLTGWDLTNLVNSVNGDGIFENMGEYSGTSTATYAVDVTNMVLGADADRLFANAAANGGNGIAQFTGLDTVNATAVESLWNAFNRCSKNGCDIDLTTWDVSNVQDINSIFSNNPWTTGTVNISGLNFSYVDDAGSIFTDFSGSADLSNVDFSSVTTFENAFSGTLLNKFTFDKMLTSNALTNMSYAFKDSQYFDYRILKNFDTSNVTTMAYMLDGTTHVVGNEMHFISNLSHLTDIRRIFSQSNIEYVDISPLNSSPISNISGMFYNSSIKTIYTGGTLMDWSSKTGDNYVFWGCSNLVGGNGTAYSSSGVKDISYARCDLVKGNAGIASDQKGYFSAALTMNHCLA